MIRWLVLTLVVLQAATCGQKGPLVLPETAQTAATLAAATRG